MPHSRNSARAAALLLVLAGGLPACQEAPFDPARAQAAAPASCANGWSGPGVPPPPIHVMTSLPLFWPLGAEVQDVLNGTAERPWQNSAIGKCYAAIALDTLSPGSGEPPEHLHAGPLAGLARLAVIQPRGLSPADNVALDAWVRGGGRLLMMLDPALTGAYDLPLGDPRRPVEAALVPPVVGRWGLAIRFDEAQSAAATRASLGEAPLPLALAGQVVITDPAAAQCALVAGGAAAQCRVGNGRVTLIADAAIFEHPELAGADGAVLQAVLAEAWETERGDDAGQAGQ